MKAAVVKFLLSLLADEKARRRILMIIGSVVAGLLCMMILPFVVLSTLNQTDPPEIEIEFNESELLSAIDTDRLTAMESDCQTIADMLSYKGLSNQIMKAQLIYLSYSDDGEITDFDEYTSIFHIEDDNILIDHLNSDYAFEIDKDEFQRTYLLVKNATIDTYLFANPETKNSADLAAWCRNAYESGWFSESGQGEINSEKQWRTADNVGLILGYFNYFPAERTFGTGIDTLVYTEQGSMDTMPDAAGIGVFTGSEFGVYDGNGQVFFSSADGQTVQKIPLSEPRWISWVTYEGIVYPQEVWDRIDELNAPEEEPEPIIEGE